MKFSQEMELEFFSRLLKDCSYVEQYVDLLKNYQGSSFSMEWIKEELVDWYRRYKSIPPMEFWRTQVENKLQGESKDQVLIVVDNLLKRESRYEEFAKDQFLDFLSSKSLESAIDEGKVLFQRTMDMGLYLSKVSQGLVEAEKLRYGSNPDKVYDWLEQRSQRESKRGIISDGLRLGIPKLDDQFVFRRGTVSAFLGPYKRYKSILLHHCGFAGLLQGYNVLHVSFENTKQQVGDRYDSRFTGIDYKRMVRALITNQEVELMEKVFERLENLPNRLKIELCVPYTNTIGTVEVAIEKLTTLQGWTPDIVIVDYVNLVACKRNLDDDYKRIELCCWDLQNLSKTKDIIVITACQSVKGAEERDDLKQSDTAGSVGILRAVDNQIAINQTPEEYKMRVIRLSPLLFRDDEIITPHIPLNAELTRMCVSRESDALWGELE